MAVQLGRVDLPQGTASWLSAEATAGSLRNRAIPMLQKLKDLLSGERPAANEIPPRLPGNEEPGGISITISAPRAERRAAVFQSDSLRALWSEVGPISHPDHPFLDPVYSPGSQMPAADFSPWVAARLGSGDWSSVWELLDFTTDDHCIAALKRTFREWDIRRFVRGDDALLNELRAIAVLGYRIQSSGQPEGRVALIRDLYQHALASHPFTIDPTACTHLVEGANRHIRRMNREFKGHGIDEPMLTPEGLLKNAEPSVSTVGHRLAGFPITYRAMLGYSMERGSPMPGTLRPQLQGHYAMRQFGLSDQQNATFIAECGLFEAPTDAEAAAGELKKDDLLAIAQATGVQAVKSWKKDRITAALLSSAPARDAITAKVSETVVQVVSTLRPEFFAWRGRAISLRGTALALACA